MSVLFSKKIFTTLILLVFLGLMIFILLSTIGGDNITTGDKSVNITPVKTINAVKGSLNKTLRLNGYIQSDNVITLVPFVSGTLDNLYVELGEQVIKNQMIASIDSRVYDLQLKQAEAAYLGAKSSFERVEQLFKSNATTRQNYDQTKTQLDAYKSQYELAQLQASYTEISSPIDGTVLVIHANQGSIAAPELPVVTIGDLSNLIVKLGVPDKYYELFRTSPDIEISIYRPKGEKNAVKAHIKNISPIISPETRNFDIACDLEGDLSTFRPGMFVYCMFNVDQIEDVYYLPHGTLGPGSSLWYVEPETSTAEKFAFTQTFSNNDFFTIPEEIANYDFIIEGQSFLTAGQRVRIK